MRGLDPRIHPLANSDGLPGLAAFGGGPAMTNGGLGPIEG
jgi:hypothetical protein